MKWRVNCPGSQWHFEIGTERARKVNPDGVTCIELVFEGDHVPVWFEEDWLMSIELEHHIIREVVHSLIHSLNLIARSVKS